MNLEEMRKRIQEIVAKLDGFNAVENYSKEDVEAINELNEEFSNLKNNIETKEKIEAMKAHSAKPQRKVAPVITPRVEVTASKLETNMGFQNLGEFSKAVSNKSKGSLDERFKNSYAQEKFSEDGGVLVPTDFMTEISEKVQGDQSLLPRTSMTPVSGNALSLPIDEKEPWNGGIKGYWLGEASTYTQSKPLLGLAHWRLHKLGALVPITDELLEDTTALEAFIKSKAPSALLHKINDAIINGDGVAKPIGLLNCGFKIAVAKESAQTADTIVYKNLVKMEAVHIPSQNSIWLAHPKCREQLRQLKDDNGNAIYMNGGAFPNMAQAGFDYLLGKPIIYMMGAMQNLGDEGDLILCDLSYYNTIVKTQGVKQDISTHLLFDKDVTCFKFVTRIDGSCPYTSPVTTEYGSYDMSGIVTLAVRA